MSETWPSYIHSYREENLLISFSVRGNYQRIFISPDQQPDRPTDSQLVVYDVIFGSWPTYEEALHSGIKAAEKFVDDHWAT
ncbi:hypothetical protein SAMN05216205_4882 [Pseudomonas mohnii]|jgi:hypothetical protein|uniref:Uncharacterized protein n=1 Tax=Pseudomonas mohnii TaxID=395600 RepID=A0ABY0YC32_9PSED|nr:hypothetical protein [Pseudomonas mohnii]SED31359.1 hypothetical protein SAMN05216205_4882 [Pseudomonas mohnii]